MASNIKCKAMIILWTLLLPLFMELCWNLVNAKACNRTVRTSVGWIRWTGRMGRCVVRIRAPLRDPQVIELRIRRLQVGTLRDSVCEGAYVQFSDGIEDLENDVGRYCGHVVGNATRLFLRKGPELSIVMDSEFKFAELNPVIFSAQFSVLPARLAYERHGVEKAGRVKEVEGSLVPSASDCSLDCKKKNNRNRRCRITSPGYPGVYPRGIRCRISLESSAGRFRIGGSNEDLFSLMNYTVEKSCSTENCDDINDEPTHLTAGRMKRNFEILDHRMIDDEDEATIIGSDDGPRIRKNNKRTKKKWMKKKKRRGRIKNNYIDDLESKTESSDNLGTRGLKIFEQRFGRTIKSSHSVYKKRNLNCVGDYLSIYENFEDGKLTEIVKLCGEGIIPEIITRGGKIVIEFFSKREGTMINDGFHLTINELESNIHARANQNHKNSILNNFIYKSSESQSGAKERRIKSLEHWYPPNTICSYKFIANNGDKILIQLKIIRKNFDEDFEESENISSGNQKANLYCPGNEIAVYNGASINDTLAWSYCDVFNNDINNIQVPVTSSGNVLLVQYYSARGSLNGDDFTYAISYKFLNIFNNHQQQHQQVRRKTTYGNRAGGGGRRGSIGRTISLKPVNFSALNITDFTNCNCDFSTRIGSFKSWFIVLVVLGVISFVGAIFTVFSIVTKCLSIRSIRENKLIENPKR